MRSLLVALRLKPLAGVACLALLTVYLVARLQAVPRTPAGLSSSGGNHHVSTAAEGLSVTDTNVSLPTHWGCVVRSIPWRIDGYGRSYYQIEWTVTRLNGPPWVWHHVTQDAQDHDTLQVELCDWIVLPGTTHYAVSGVIDVVNLAQRAAGRSLPGTASLTVIVPSPTT
jgi:hypothetical protein